MGFFKDFRKKISDAVDKAGGEITKASEAIGFNKLKEGLEKTRSRFVDQIQFVLGKGRKIDEELLEELEEIMITSDMGINTTDEILEKLRDRVKKEGHESGEDVFKILKEEIHNIMIESPSAENDRTYSIPEDNKPYVILVIGVNGVGKTTTIGKLAYNYKNNGKSVIIGAADTFRAAANEQLEIWAERAGVDIIQQKHGADPAAVAYDTLMSAKSKNKDVVMIDTAGRLHNKANLMAELEKISRVVKKVKPEAPDEVFLVLDATTGQNAIQQAKEFTRVAPITGIVLTKLDGTAKGGVVIPIASELKLPVRFIGVGEKIDDMQVFDPTAFTEAMFGKTVSEEIEEEE
jgi:fused signal recognition particle receptor